VLSSIPEGDFIPLTNIERIITIFYKLTSIIFYSYVINYFKVQQADFKQKTSNNLEKEEHAISEWLISL
jgi:hypothetical protein